MTWILALASAGLLAAPGIPPAAPPRALSEQDEDVIWAEWFLAECAAAEKLARESERLAGDRGEAAWTAARDKAKREFAAQHGLTLDQLDAAVRSVAARQRQAQEDAARTARRRNWILAGLFFANIPLYLLFTWMFFHNWASLGELLPWGLSWWDRKYGPEGIDYRWAWLKMAAVIGMSLFTVLNEYRIVCGWGW